MSVEGLISTLGYGDSPNFLSGNQLEEILGLSHVFRRAREKCALRGVYALREKIETAAETLALIQAY
jgi:hypothetical protein